MARILVGDDDPHVLELVSLMLKRAGHQVVTTDSPCDVLALALRTRFDVIVLDVMTTPISGFEILSELRRNEATASVPVLMLSGRAISGRDRVRGLREGADDYLIKPFEPEELALRIEHLICRRLADRPPADDRGPETAAAVPGAGGRRLGRYEVRGVLGQGTMGRVYRGWDPRLQRPVALKTIRFDAVVGPDERREMLSRLRQEAVTIARFNHPNIVGVYDMSAATDSAWVAMELVEGVSMDAHLATIGTLPAAKVIPLAAGIARGLAAAHARKVIHRDVKPANVLLGRDGEVKVTDFGIAYVATKTTEGSKELYGTPGYVPPEVLRQEPYTQAGDLFGLGATIYKALAGQHPFAGATAQETIRKTLALDVTPLAERVVGVPDELARLVAALLASDPGQRPTAEAATETLEQSAAASNLRWTAADLADHRRN